MGDDAELSRVDSLGSVLFVVALLVAAGIAWYLYNSWSDKTKEAMNADASESKHITASPEDTPPPASNAPVLGPAKTVIVPASFTESKQEEDGVFTLPEKAVVRWDLLPPTARVVSFCFRMSNPPLTGNSPNDKKYQVLATTPVTNGFSIAMEDRGKYVISAGRHTFKYTRDFSLWKPSEESVSVRFVQLGQNSTRVEVVYNGNESILQDTIDGLSVSEIKSWPQQLLVPHRQKIQNIWITYA